MTGVCKKHDRDLGQVERFVMHTCAIIRNQQIAKATSSVRAWIGQADSLHASLPLIVGILLGLTGLEFLHQKPKQIRPAHA